MLRSCDVLLPTSLSLCVYVACIASRSPSYELWEGLSSGKAPVNGK